ncbi:10814_t:CDS:2 [Entrophospora sp. SA101]|nr:10814_t:CDS:2 [Entrophospora sp. SA101]
MHPVHAPVLPKISRKRLSDDDKDNYNNKKDAKKFNVSDWKIQFVESYKYYVTEVCTVCGQPGEPIPVWEVRLCRFCVVRQLINKSALTSFSLTSKEYEVLKKRQAERFTKEITKRKRKQREQEQSCAERTHAILRCFKELRLKAELSVMEEWWFPKELKLEIQEAFYHL